MGVSESFISNIHGKIKKHSLSFPYMITVSCVMIKPVECYLFEEHKSSCVHNSDKT